MITKKSLSFGSDDEIITTLLQRNNIISNLQYPWDQLRDRYRNFEIAHHIDNNNNIVTISSSSFSMMNMDQFWNPSITKKTNNNEEIESSTSSTSTSSSMNNNHDIDGHEQTNQ